MSVSPPILDSPDPENLSVGVVRQTVELLALLCVGVILFRAFAAEAYIVPTGSMAPTLLGRHLDITCPGCGFRFDVGIDEEAHQARPVCPNCGQRDFDRRPGVVSGGDRVLVQKLVYEFRAPRRWEVAVFQYPADPSQAYVKRVVGLPGESVQIVDGDVHVNGRVARKSPHDIRATRILAHDGRHAPADSSRHPRWEFRRGPRLQIEPSGWSQGTDGFHHELVDYSGLGTDDWLIYRHWDPILERYGPIRDHYGYNGVDLGSDNIVKDIGLEARVRIGPAVEELSIMLRSAGDRFIVRIPVGRDGPVRLTRNGTSQRLDLRDNPLAVATVEETEHLLEAYVFDQRVTVAIDGELAFEPFDYDDPVEPRYNDESPAALGVRGGAMAAPDLKIYRDIHYTDSLGAIHRHPHGVMAPYQLKRDEYFVLGDNSPVSNDSRFWAASPVVPRSMFLGKPFLVHLPGRVMALEVFGRSVYWIPDPRRIRYIH